MLHRFLLAALALLVCIHAEAAGQSSQGAPAATGVVPAVAARFDAGVGIARLDAGAWRRAADAPGPLVVPEFRVAPDLAITLRLHRFRITGPDTRFVLGTVDGPDRPLDFDPESIVLLRGSVDGWPDSHVFMAISPLESVARIDLGQSRRKFLLTTRASTRVALGAGEAMVLEAQVGGGGASLPVPLCGVTDQPLMMPQGVPPLTRGLRRVRMAIETDYELFELFGDSTATATYVMQVYAAMSDIFVRDVSARIELSYVRIWDNPADLYNGIEEPLGAFVTNWNANQRSVVRDVAQYFSGRRDLNAGGVAYLNSLCNNTAYSWAGYALGYFIDPDRPSWTNRDIMVAAHELGHNCGTGHTQDYGLDNCDTGLPPAKRGSIMSYCGQGYSGGDANHDLWFHEVTAAFMRSYMASRPCLVFDCDSNGNSDVGDISGGAADANADQIPDICEDCNSNGILDPAEIVAGTTPDVNQNNIPDGCEADCNGNGVPDPFETNQNPAIDLNRNRIPDSCEPDLDQNGVADYNQIQADMPLDINRNLILDSREDCDGDGTPDAAERDHAWNMYIATMHESADVREFHALSGVLTRVGGAGLVPGAQDLIITPDRRVLVSSGPQNRVALLDRDGNHLGSFVPAGAGGLNFPTGMLLVGNRLLVASRGTNSVLEFDTTFGTFLRTLVLPGAGGLVAPFGLATRPASQGGGLFVTSSDNRVLEFNIQTGAFVRTFVAAGSGPLANPRGLVFKPDGNLLVCSFAGNRVQEHDGTTGAFIGRWNRNGAGGRLLLEQPWCIRIGPDGDVYVSRSIAHGNMGGGDPPPDRLHLTDARIYHFDIRNGNYVRAFVLGDDTGLFEPTGFDFMRGEMTDCNRNYLPDNCDIASGSSRDDNGDGVPDECQTFCRADFNHSGAVDPDDLSDFITCFFLQAQMPGVCPGADFNGDGNFDPDDLADFITAFFVAPC